MKTRIPKIFIFVLILSLAGIAITVLSTYFFIRLNQVVHSDLYNYGLQFNYEWAGQYWTYARLIFGFLEVAIVTTCISMIFILIRVRTGEIEPAKFVSCLLLIVGIVTAGFSAFFFTQLDYIVHNALYRYGLQFNYEWAVQYWTYAKLTLALLGVAITTNGISIVLVLSSERISEIKRFLSTQLPRKINSTKLICSILFSFGIIALAFSINYASSILAFIGLGLVFWGAILFYIRPEKYVKENLLDKTTLPLLTSLDQMIIELGYKGKGVYLPPTYLKDFESSKVYISAREDTNLPSPEQIQKQEGKVILKNSEGILITPPGMELTRLFEETLGTNFTKVDLHYIERNMPKLLIEDLEIAQSIEIETKNNIVNVKIEDPIYKSLCYEARNLTNIHGSIGCPLCSAIACALAKATGKPILIEKDQTSTQGQTINIEYRLLEEPEEKTQ